MQYPRCPHCNIILPEFGPWEKKICPNCEQKVILPNDKGISSTPAKDFLKSCRIWIVILVIFFLTVLFTEGFIGACCGLALEGVLVYMLMSWKRNKILREHLYSKLPLCDPKAGELLVRKGQLKYYRNCVVTYVALVGGLFVLLALCIGILPEKISSSNALDPIVFLMIWAGCCGAWNLLCLLLRAITFRRKLPDDTQCTHAPVAEPFPGKKQKRSGIFKVMVFFCGLYVVIGGILTIGALIDQNYRKQHPEKYVKINATVVDVQTFEDDDDEGSSETTVYVSYTYDGIEYNDAMLPGGGNKVVGQTVPITIKRDVPDVICTEPDVTTGLFSLGTGLVGFAIYFLVSKRSKKKSECDD